MAKFQRRRGRDVPKSKRLTNNPYAIRGVKLRGLEGGLVTRQPLPNGNILVTITDENGRKTETIEEATNDHT